MKILKTIISVSVAVILLFTVILQAQSASEIPDGLITEAETCLMDFLTKSDPDILARSCVWWRPDDKPENYTLSEPYPVYRLISEELDSINNEVDFKNTLTLFAWKIPVSYGDDPRLLIGMNEIEGEWRCGGLGRDPLPIYYIRSRMPPSDGYMHSYVMMTNGPDFIVIEKGSDLFFFPFNTRNEFILDIQRDDGGHYPVLPFDTMMMKLMDAAEAGKI